jgi:YD repeat-containing protein
MSSALIILKNVSTDAFPGGQSESYSYSPTRNLAGKITTPAAGSGLSPISVGATYNCTIAPNCAKPASITDANGATTDFTYDPAHGGILTETGPPDANEGRPQTRYSRQQYTTNSSINHDLYGTTQDVSFSMGNYNPSGQVGNRTVSNTAYVWGGAVNLSRGYATNGQNQYSTAGNVAFTYDPNGNLTSETTSGSSTRQYRYDIENRLVEVWEGGAQTVALRYDPLGRLYEVSGVNGITRFLWDGDELIAEYNASGTLLRRYVHGARVDDPTIRAV